MGTAWSARKACFIDNSPSVTGPDRPNVDHVFAAHYVKLAVEINGGVAVGREKFNGRTDTRSCAAVKIQRAMLVAHEAEGRVGRRAAQRDRLATVGGKRLPS